MIIKKFKAYSKRLGMSESIILEDLINNKTDFDEYDIYLQYLGYNDASERELYEGDVIELKITDELMKTSFSNSNLGKYIKENPNITSIVLEHKTDSSCVSMDYDVYAKVDGEFVYRSDKKVKTIASGEDTMFPKYLVSKGAVYIGNVMENPYLIQQKPSLKQNDIFLYYRPFNYDGDVKFDGKAAVIEVKDNKVKVQYLETYDNSDVGKIVELPLQEILDNADLCFSPLNLKNYLHNNQYYNYFNTNKEVIEFYKNNFHMSDKDLIYLDKYNDLINSLDQNEVDFDEIDI